MKTLIAASLTALSIPIGWGAVVATASPQEFDRNVTHWSISVCNYSKEDVLITSDDLVQRFAGKLSFLDVTQREWTEHERPASKASRTLTVIGAAAGSATAGQAASWIKISEEEYQAIAPVVMGLIVIGKMVVKGRERPPATYWTREGFLIPPRALTGRCESARMISLASGQKEAFSVMWEELKPPEASLIPSSRILEILPIEAGNPSFLADVQEASCVARPSSVTMEDGVCPWW